MLRSLFYSLVSIHALREEHSITLFDLLSLYPHVEYNFLSTVISHLSSTNMSICFITTVYAFFFTYPQKRSLSVKCDNMPRRWGTLKHLNTHIYIYTHIYIKVGYRTSSSFFSNNVGKTDSHDMTHLKFTNLFPRAFILTQSNFKH